MEGGRDEKQGDLDLRATSVMQRVPRYSWYSCRLGIEQQGPVQQHAPSSFQQALLWSIFPMTKKETQIERLQFVEVRDFFSNPSKRRKEKTLQSGY